MTEEKPDTTLFPSVPSLGSMFPSVPSLGSLDLTQDHNGQTLPYDARKESYDAARARVSTFLFIDMPFELVRYSPTTTKSSRKMETRMKNSLTKTMIIRTRKVTLTVKTTKEATTPAMRPCSECEDEEAVRKVMGKTVERAKASMKTIRGANPRDSMRKAPRGEMLRIKPLSLAAQDQIIHQMTPQTFYVVPPAPSLKRSHTPSNRITFRPTVYLLRPP